MDPGDGGSIAVPTVDIESLFSQVLMPESAITFSESDQKRSVSFSSDQPQNLKSAAADAAGKSKRSAVPAIFDCIGPIMSDICSRRFSPSAQVAKGGF